MTKNINIHISASTCEFASRIFKQAHSLTANNIFEKVIVLATWKENLKEEEFLGGNERILIKRQKIVSPLMNKSNFKRFSSYIQWLIVVLKFCKRTNPAVITAHSIPTLPLAVIVKYFTNANLVYDAHELETERNGLKGTKQTLARIIERFFIKFVDETIVVSQNIKEFYDEKYNINSHLVLNCPDKKEVVKTNYFRDHFEIPDSAKVFIYQGGFNKNRGIELMLETFKDFNPNKYRLVFMGYGLHEDKVREYAQKYSSIHYHPAVPYNDVLNYTASADYGISVLVFKETTCLSYYYCLPNKFFEYTLAGIPTIGTNIPEFRSVIDKYGNGVVMKENSVASLTEAVEAIQSKDTEEYMKNKDSLFAHYNWEVQEENLKKIYTPIS